MSLADCTLVAYCDPAGGKAAQPVVKKTRARAAIVVIAQDALERIFVCYTWAERCSTDTLIEQMFKVSEAWRPTIFGGEADGLQGLFQDAVMREARLTGKQIPLVPHRHSTKVTKIYRIRTTLQPVIAHGRLFLQPHQAELHAELLAFPRGRTVDIVDALASAIMLMPPRSAVRERDDERDALAAYLRRSGCPPEQIQARLAELSAA